MTYEEDHKSLLNDLKAGDRNAIAFVYENYRKLLTVSAIVILKDEEAAKDLVQQFYIDFFEQRLYLRIRSGNNLKTYLVSCVRNRCLNKVRDMRRSQKKMEKIIDKFPTAEAERITIEENDIWTKDQITRQKLNAALTQTYREVPVSAKTLELRYFQGLSREEIAERTGVTVNTVKNNLKRALSILRKHFKNANDK